MKKGLIKATFQLPDLSGFGPVYLVGGSLRDRILNLPSSDYDFALAGDVREFARKVAEKLGAHLIQIGKKDKAVYRVVTGTSTLDFSSIEGKSIEDDLNRRDFTINALGYELRSEKLVDPVGGLDDIRSKRIRLISKDAILADPLRMLRAFRFAAVLDFEITSETLMSIKEQSCLITRAAGERIHDEMLKIMEVDSSFPYVKQMAEAGILSGIIPELEACRGCVQNREHRFDVFEHTMQTYKEIETILSNPGKVWPESAVAVSDYLRKENHRVLLKWVALLHDLGKPKTRSIDETGKIRFLRHEDTGADIAQDICARLRMSAKSREYITFLVKKHLYPLFLFVSHQKGNLTSKAIVRLIAKYQDDIIGLLIHGLADQRAKAQETPEGLEAFSSFLKQILMVYFCDLKPRMEAPRLVTGQDLIDHFGLVPSKVFGKILNKVEEARLNGDIRTRKEAFKLVERLLEGDAGIEPATPSSGGLCSIR